MLQLVNQSSIAFILLPNNGLRRIEPPPWEGSNWALTSTSDHRVSKSKNINQAILKDLFVPSTAHYPSLPLCPSSFRRQ